MSQLEFLNPKDWVAPVGYANGVAARGKTVFVAGQVGWKPDATMVADDLVAQTEQALRNILAVLAEAGGTAEHIVRMTWYVVDKADYVARRRDIGAVYRRVIGKHFPAMSLVVVAGLLEDDAKVEIEATAVVPG